jgi:hypothetical protein
MGNTGYHGGFILISLLLRTPKPHSAGALAFVANQVTIILSESLCNREKEEGEDHGKRYYIFNHDE